MAVHTRVTTISVPPDEMDRLDDLAHEHRLTRSTVLRIGADLVAKLPDEELRRQAEIFLDGRIARHRKNGQHPSEETSAVKESPRHRRHGQE